MKPDGAGLCSECGLAAAVKFLRLGIDDFNKLWLEGGSAYEETVHVLLGGELFAGSAGNRA